jgi:putative transposase
VDKRVIFPEGPSPEREYFVALMRRLESFTGIRVIAFVIMPNHYHILCEVPKAPELSNEELLERIEGRYGLARRELVAELLRSWTHEGVMAEEGQRIRNRYLARMYDLSVFHKELKGQFAQWYNRRHQRVGVLWSERFASVVAEEGQAVAAISAYVDLNPVRANICPDPKDYRYCGYAEAVSGANPKRREGIRIALGLGPNTGWEEVSRAYRKLLFQTGIRPADGHRGGFEEEEVERVVEQEKGELSAPELLRCKIRHFTEGKIVGAKGFVEGLSKRFSDVLQYKRPRKPCRIEEMKWTEMWAFLRPQRRGTG